MAQSSSLYDPKYRLYHRVVSHRLEKCITHEEHIMQLDSEGIITLDLDDTIEANYICAKLEYSLSSLWQGLI